MLKVLIYALPIILAIYALVDLVQTRDEDVQGLPKLVWVVLIVLVWVVGPVAWLVAGRRGRSFLPDAQPRAADGPATGRRPLAPDDDPDFLRNLGRRAPPRPPAAPPTSSTDPPRVDRPDGEANDKPDDDPPLTAR